MAKHYDRKAEDLGNITGLEHVNLQIPDQSLATLFYIQGLGLTRDPYMNTGLANMWVNVGKSQFHLPTGEPWVLRGAIALVTPDRDQLLKRLDSVRKPLAGTKFQVKENNDYVEVTCPWGNKFNMHSPDMERFGAINLGMPYLHFDVPKGTAKGIEKFYKKIFGAKTSLDGNGSGKTARINVGLGQDLLFRETKGKLPAYDGHHIQVYVQDFSGPYKELMKRDLLTEESNAYQYRWETIVDPKTNKVLFEIEHEIRSMTHPLYMRPLVNRNPMQSQQSYEMGGDAWDWEIRRSNVRLPDVPPPSGPSATAYAKRRETRMARAM
ncbi:MAG: VOC family protein [Terriglobia bacterium]